MLPKLSITFILCFILFANKIKAQYILLKDYNVILSNNKSGCHDTLTEYSRDGRKVIIQLFDCMGKMYVKVYKNNRLLEEGSYINSLDTLRGYTYKNTLGGEKKIVVESYFQPLRDGVWLFYNSKGSIFKKVSYKEGVQIEL